MKDPKSTANRTLSGLGWNIVVFLFASAWLYAAGYTLYGLFANYGEMSLAWIFFSLTLLAVFGVIAAVGTAVSLMGIYGYTRALINDTDPSYG